MKLQAWKDSIGLLGSTCESLCVIGLYFATRSLGAMSFAISSSCSPHLPFDLKPPTKRFARLKTIGARLDFDNKVYRFYVPRIDTASLHLCIETQYSICMVCKKVHLSIETQTEVWFSRLNHG